ncbi:MAG: cobalamin biosynthesis protein CobQ [Mogibacterium sp.]|nr:cobalamin biosynthesis protein CobQ [Mogibacterium sp.]
MSERKLEIAWMYPDTLYLHGERGNIMALVRYAMELGMTPHVKRIDLGTRDFDPLDYDILFFGPGEISSFSSIISDISRYRHTLAEYIASGKVLIATGTTVTMFGEKIVRLGDTEGAEGEVIDGLCIIPAMAYERDYVYGNDLYTRAEYNGYSMELVGNQIQMADYGYSENEQYRRFGTVIYGRGNNGSDGIDGAVLVNSVFTGMLGPVLVNNPWLTVRLLQTAASVGGIRTSSEPLRFNLEQKSLKLKKQFIESKNTV